MKKKVLGMVCCIIGAFVLLLIFQHIYSSRLVMRFSIIREETFWDAIYIEIYQDKTIHIIDGPRREDNNLDAKDYVEQPWNDIQEKLSSEQYKMCTNLCNAVFAECKSRPFSEAGPVYECTHCWTYCLSYKNKSFHMYDEERDEYLPLYKLGRILDEICRGYGLHF